jgi:hypothetical protein
MFDVGRTYEIHYLEDGREVSSTCRVEQWQAPLLRVSRPGTADTIFNTTSQNFLRAAPQPLPANERAAEPPAHRTVESAEMDVVAAGIA